MPNTPTTPASVASRLTDEEIERLASNCYEHAYDFGFYTLAHNDEKRKAAVLRDYVRLRRLVNAVKTVAIGKDSDYHKVTEIERLLAEVETKGEK